MANDTKTKIMVEFNAEKTAAMRMYLSAKGMQIESELAKTLETLYDKHVPTQVRDFILMKENTAPKKESKPAKSTFQKDTFGDGFE